MVSKRLAGRWALVVVLLLGFGSGAPCFAQRGNGQGGGLPPGIKLKPKEGDQVEANYLGEWRPGVVMQVGRNEAVVDVEFGSGVSRRSFAFADLRFPWQANAISPVYNWTDQSGTYSVKAAVIDFDRDKGTVTLYKLDDGEETTLPINKLGDADQKRLQQIMGNAPLKAAEQMEIVEFSTNNLNLPIAWKSAQDLSGISPDPPAIEVAVPSGGAAFPALDFWDNFLSLYPIGTSSGWMAAATGAKHGVKEEKFPGRLIWATIADGKIRKQQSIPNGERLIAVDPASQRVLTVGTNGVWGLEEKVTLTIFNASPKTDKATPEVRWVSHADKIIIDAPFAEFVGAGRVLHRWGRGRYVVWDIEKREAVYEVKQESFFGAPPVLSPGKQYLALPEDSGVRILSAADGQTLAVLPIEEGKTSGVAFDARGEKLAVLTRGQLAVWRLGSSEPPERVRADGVGSPFAQQVAWVDDRSILVAGKTLFDLDLQLPIWSYDAEFSEVVEGHALGTVTQVVAGRLCYAVNVDRTGRNIFVVGAVELPGDKVREIVSQVDQDRLWALRPGVGVQVVVNCGGDSAAAKAALEAKIRSNGWVIQPNAKYVVTAEMGRGQSQQVTYEFRGGSGGSETVTVTPYFSSLKIMEGNDMIWSSGSSSGGAPPFVFLLPGESIQSKVQSTERPDPGFFQRVEIPQKILDPKFRDGYGTSTYGRNGLTAKVDEGLPLKSE